ncbi:acetylxylan esterase [Asanoa ishikariensis]|uniref:Cephalosporin-C deacetylase n=1 Tax=Asanoa ishikariensis TaxID=137265 RepID=A0A1H3T283_9ACTN|nr:acetylxylan esterase [Asanoa ishikariensis]GIF63161.1 acetylxylan esterase [Asanoa ishikariensis]SDZ43855.1 cephalosporin-C deacetylase [Asanoa ishikariensis]
MQLDLSLDELAAYRYADEPEPADFDAFWSRTLSEAGRIPVAAEFAPYDALLRTVDTFDVTFAGYGGDPIKGWLILPADRSGPLPTVVEYIGYGGGRGEPLEWLAYASAGYAHFVMDTRGQGSTWRTGDTADPGASGPAVPGYVTRGILDPHDYYYRRLYVDAYRAVDAAAAHPDVDPSRIAVTGRSQGGALSVAVGGLRHDIAAAIPHVPFLSAFRRATSITDANPYAEIVRWCATHRTKAEQAFATLAYFDGTSFATRATCRGSFSVALMDPICPPSTVYAAHNVWGGPKDIAVWPYNDHDGGGPEDQLRTIRVLRELFG